MPLNSFDISNDNKLIQQITQSGISIFKNKIANLNWMHLYANEDSKFCYNSFHSKLLSIIEPRFYYRRKKTISNNNCRNKNWFTAELYYIKVMLNRLHEYLLNKYDEFAKKYISLNAFN